MSNISSKAVGGIASANTKAGESSPAMETMQDDGKTTEKQKKMLQRAKDEKQKKKLQRAKDQKNFLKNYKPIRHEEPKDTNIVGNITKLLPANTFLMFQTLTPLATNDGHCGKAEIIMTSVMLIILASTCMLVCFTDTIQFNGKVYHGLVTRRGLWNPSFKDDPSFADLRKHEQNLARFYEALNRYKSKKLEALDKQNSKPERSKKPEELPKPMQPHVMGSTFSSGNSQYELRFTDFLHAMLSAMAFGTLTMLTSPVSTCFYPNIPSAVVKTLPLLVGFVISAIFAFSPPARNGIAHPLSPKVPSQMNNYKPPDPKGVVHGPSLPPKPPGGEGDRDHANPKPDDNFNGKTRRNDTKNIHIPFELQEAAKSVPHDALVAGLVNALGIAAVQSAVQDAKDAALTQMHQELQAPNSGSLAGLTRQSSMALTGANSMLQSRGSSLSLPSGPDALFHQAPQVLQRQVSGLPPNVHAAGSEATAIALTTGQALMQAGSSQLPQATALNAFAHNIGNQLNLNSANELGVAQGMGQAGSQPATSIAIDIASVLQQESPVHSQLARQASALSPQMQGAATMMQRQVRFGKFQQPSAADTHMAFRHLASPLSSPQGSPEFGVSQWMLTSPSNWRDNASLTIEDVTAAAAGGQRGMDRVQHGSSQLPRVTEEIAAQARDQAPTASQVRLVSSEIVTSTSEAPGKVAIANMTHILRNDRPESTEITDSISIEEITREFESEFSNCGHFRAGSSSSFNLQEPLKKKL